jgi:hypothetical protein
MSFIFLATEIRDPKKLLIIFSFSMRWKVLSSKMAPPPDKGHVGEVLVSVILRSSLPGTRDSAVCLWTLITDGSRSNFNKMSAKSKILWNYFDVKIRYLGSFIKYNSSRNCYFDNWSSKHLTVCINNTWVKALESVWLDFPFLVNGHIGFLSSQVSPMPIKWECQHFC